MLPRQPILCYLQLLVIQEVTLVTLMVMMTVMINSFSALCRLIGGEEGTTTDPSIPPTGTSPGVSTDGGSGNSATPHPVNCNATMR